MIVVIGGFRVQQYPLFTKYNEMDRPWKIIKSMTRLFNARKVVECPLCVELIFEVELASLLIYESIVRELTESFYMVYLV
jgi:hypothetical protein